LNDLERKGVHDSGTSCHTARHVSTLPEGGSMHAVDRILPDAGYYSGN